MNAFPRLAIVAATVYVSVHLAIWEPALLFPIGVLASVFGAVWWLSAKYDEQRAMDELAESGAVEAAFGPHMVAIAVEEHHDRWAE